MRVLELTEGGSPRDHGRAHGETFRGLVVELAELRVERIAEAWGTGPSPVVASAEKHLPVLARYDTALNEELTGIAEGAGVSLAEIVVLNHYTDLRDLSPGGREEGCSAVYARTPEGVLLGQTWDMHGSAMPYVMMLRVPAREASPEAWLLTITGCVGMAGFNGAGLGIAINNLRSTDAKIGLVWPALVRRVLRERTAEAARDVILEAPLGSGHHYLCATRDGAYGIETSGVRREVVFDGTHDYVHTNHCLDRSIDEVTVDAPGSTTRERYKSLCAGLERAPIRGRADLWERLGSHEGYPRGVCTHLAGPADPHGMLTCAGMVIDLTANDAWAAGGCVHRARPHVFELAR